MQQLNSTQNMNTFGPQVAEIFESEIVEKYYATHERVKTTLVKSSLSQQILCVC